ncbi:MAG: hypothetical protein ACI4ES_05925, partial [Roseburia sp.]
HPALLTFLPFDTIPICFLEKFTVSFSSFGILSHMEGGDARRVVIERLPQNDEPIFLVLEDSSENMMDEDLPF